MFRSLLSLCITSIVLLFSLSAFDSVFAQFPRNKKIVYLRGPNNQESLWIMNGDGSGQTQVCNCPGAKDHVLSPDGLKIAFVRLDKVWVINTDGSGLIDLTPSGASYLEHPTWSPDSQEIAFDGDVMVEGFHATNIYRINVDGTNLRRLTTVDRVEIFANYVPSWSPDGTRIAFQSVRLGHGNHSEIYVMSAAGGPAMCLTRKYPNTFGEGGFRLPVWSPDSSRIVSLLDGEACGDGPGGLAGFYIMNADGSGPVSRITECFLSTTVAWSPNGRALAFNYHNLPDEARALQTMKPDGSDRKPVFPFPTFAGTPIWSPDSKQLLFSDGGQNGDPGLEFYAANFDGSGKTNLTNTPQISELEPRIAQGTVCDMPAIPTPPIQNVSTSWPYLPIEPNPNWSMTIEVSADDGLKVKDVRLASRYLAKEISVPYYTLETTNRAKQRGELKPNSNDSSMRSRLVDFSIEEDAEKLVVEAVYAIDQIGGSCLRINQRYEFYRTGVGGGCEPSETLPCNRWKPIVSYQFLGKNDTLRSINIAQRQHLTIDNNSFNTVGIFKDCDWPPTCGMVGGNTIPGIFGFEHKRNPLFREVYVRAITGGLNSHQWDNIHQTYRGRIEEPPLAWSPKSNFVGGGCPECAHSHWRWGEVTGFAFNAGNILGIPVGSNQDMDFAVVRYQAGEDDPADVKNLVQDETWIRTFDVSGRNPLQVHWESAPEETVLWQSATGYQYSDSFFGFGGFFNPALSSNRLFGGSPSAPTVQGPGDDEITSIVASRIFETDPVTISPFDASLGGTLPAGYSLYNDQSYDVTTNAEASGPYTITFSLPSVSDQTTFDKVRIFHLEQDEYDPDGFVWVDRTVLTPDPDAPNFENKSINARTNLLGQFAVGLLTDPQPPSGVADLSVTIADSSDPVIAGNNVTYTVTVTNAGPQIATGIGLADVLPPNSNLISVEATQGSCKESEEGAILCKLGTLDVGLSTVVTIVARLSDSGRPLPPEGESTNNMVHIKAKEVDSNTANNTATETTTVIPDTNAAPSVNITNPATNSSVVGPANIQIAATASDTDGTINSVEFFDNGQSIGLGASIGNNQYTFSWGNVGFGNHSLVAVASDNNSKKAISNVANFFVNGTAFVAITNPSDIAEFTTPAAVVIEATATQAGGSISKVDFYANRALIGTGSLFAQGRYRITWTNAYTGTFSLTAAATDNNGVVTFSPPVTVFLTTSLNQSPTVSMSAPVDGSVFTSPTNVTLTATANDSDGSITGVMFYADGTPIGSGTPAGSNQYTYSWVNPSIGIHSLIAVATDNRNAASNSSAVSIRVLSPALLVAGSTTLNSSDTAVKNRLEALNFSVTVKDHTSVTTADATGKALVMISSTVTPATVGTKFRNVAVPVITWESGLYANMGMTETASQDSGTKTNQTQVSITNSIHPLAAAFPANVVVTTSSATVNWGKPNANAAVIATVPGDAAKVVIFAYENGTVMPGLTAPARRVGLFMSDTSASIFTADGTILLDAAIQWASGLTGGPTAGSLTATFAFSPVGIVNLSNEGTVDWAHWGRNSATAYDRRAGSTQRITNVTKIGAGESGWFSDNPTGYSWTGGTPTASATNTTTGILTNTAVGNGFEMTIPADQTLRTLKLYLGVWNSQGRLEATLSDGSAPQLVDTTLDKNGGAASHGVYEIKFKASSIGQRLRVRFTIQTLYFAPFGNVAWESATMR